MLGRAIYARVERGDGYELVEGAAPDDLLNATHETHVRLTGSHPVSPSPSVVLMPDMTAARRVRYAFPTLATSSRERIYLMLPGYYRVELLEGPTYRVDPTRREAVRHVAKKSVLRFLRPKYVPPPELPPLPPGPDVNVRRTGESERNPQ